MHQKSCLFASFRSLWICNPHFASFASFSHRVFSYMLWNFFSALCAHMSKIHSSRTVFIHEVVVAFISAHKQFHLKIMCSFFFLSFLRILLTIFFYTHWKVLHQSCTAFSLIMRYMGVRMFKLFRSYASLCGRMGKALVLLYRHHRF